MKLIDKLLAFFGLERRAPLEQALRELCPTPTRWPNDWVPEQEEESIALENARKSWIEAYGGPARA